jgi:hypothetical protein
VTIEAQVKKLSPQPGEVIVLTGVELPRDPDGAPIPGVMERLKEELPEGVFLWVFQSPDADARVMKPDWMIEP